MTSLAIYGFRRPGKGDTPEREWMIAAWAKRLGFHRLLFWKLRRLIQRDFSPRHRTAGATGLTISDGDSHLIKTRWERQRLSPLDETTVFSEYYFPWDFKFLPEARESPAIVQSDAQHVNHCPRFTAKLVKTQSPAVNLHRHVEHRTFV